MSYPGHEDFGRGDLYFTGAPMSAGAERVATGVLIERARHVAITDVYPTITALADRLAELHEALRTLRDDSDHWSMQKVREFAADAVGE